MVFDSIFERSRMSEIRRSSWSPLLVMSRLYSCFSASLNGMSSLVSRLAKPMMALRGVRISWLMLARNALFSRSLSLALSRAARSPSSEVLWAWMLWHIPTMRQGDPSPVCPRYTDCSSNHSHVPSPRRSRYVNVSGFISPASCFAKASASLPRSSGCTSLKKSSVPIVPSPAGRPKWANQRSSMTILLWPRSKNHGNIFVCDRAMPRMNLREISSSVLRNRKTIRRSCRRRS